MSMSMSTKIEDLPGPIPEEVRNDLNNIQNNFSRQSKDQYEDDIVRQNTFQNSQLIESAVNPEMYRQSPQESNIQLNIKKRVKFQDETKDETTEKENQGILTFIQDQVNEDNLLLLIVLIVSSRTDLDPYIKNLPGLGSHLTDSLILVTIVRCFLLLVVYIVFRQYILPKIKV
jgi:hypothetical protein